MLFQILLEKLSKVSSSKNAEGILIKGFQFTYQIIL